MKTIVFLHIPKTAGQTIHNEMARVVGQKLTSPIRVHTQASPQDQFPVGYRLYSGHLDWKVLHDSPADRFIFSVLRDPRERIASFYFYLLEKAEKLDAETLAQPQHTGLHTVLNHSADDYFFGGNVAWRTFIRDHYDNFYCTYFATQKMRGWSEVLKLNKEVLIQRALAGAANIDAIYTLDSLSQLEQDLLPVLGAPVHLVKTHHNVGSQPADEKRWPRLLKRLEKDDTAKRLERFAALDDKLMSRLPLR